MAILNSGLAKSSAAAGYEIDNSLRFNDNDGYLYRTFPAAGNQKTWTWSGWVKKAKIDAALYLLATDYSDTANYMHCNIRAAHATESKNYIGQVVWEISDTARLLTTTRKFRDPGAWMHICIVVNTPAVSADERIRFYVNGEEVTDFGNDDRSGVTQSSDLPMNRLGRHEIAGWNGTNDASGYMAEVYFIDGTALTPASFGETDSTTNQWIPLDSDDVKDAVTFGTNGFFQKYNSTELAASFADSSGGFVPSESLTCDVLVVAGGGGGGSAYNPGGAYVYADGGGGAGGVRQISDQAFTAQTYNVVVGDGGDKSTGNQAGDSGGTSSVAGISASGGGGGGSNINTHNGTSGGSGGGNAGGSGSAAPVGNTGGYTPVEGYAGGQGGGSAYGGGGGGGASEVGASELGYHDGTGGAGGDGVSNDWRTGSGVNYGGGGGGGAQGSDSAGAGGNGGGGAGGAASANGTDGTANTGGGGGGAGSQPGAAGSPLGGNGGSGIVVIRYISTTAKASGGTITSYVDGGDTYQVHTFTSSAAPHTITANGDVKNVRGADLDTTYDTFASFTSTGADTWTCPAGVTSVEVLTVGAGGGGGGYYYAGGGGAGGVVYDSTYAVTAGVVYDLTVGTGGTAGAGGGGRGGSGSDSVFNVNAEGSGLALTATGGGGGGSYGTAPIRNGIDGGSGGGAGPQGGDGTGGSSTQASFSGATSYGNAGGSAGGNESAGSGGGGAGEAGNVDGGPGSGAGGYGGDGVLFSTFTSYGVSGYFAGGGGGGGGSGPSVAGPGGTGGGGNGAAYNSSAAVAGTANTGGGGGAGSNHIGSPSTSTGAAGGSGVVLIKWTLDKPGSSSIEFDGTGDYLSVPDSSDWDFTGDFTAEWWMNWDGDTTAGQRGISTGTQAGGSQGVQWRYDGVGWYLHVAGSEIYYVEGFSANTWHHLAIVRDGSTIKGYLDGVAMTMDTTADTITSASTITGLGFNLAANTDGGQDKYIGYMDEVRVSNSARYDATFTVPRTQFTADANTKLLIHSDWTGGLGADSSGNYNNFSATNLVATDQCGDTPTNNFATWNPLSKRTDGSQIVTLLEGNLKCTTVSVGGAGANEAANTIGMGSGKWYAEMEVISMGSGSLWLGISNSKFPQNEYIETGSWIGVYYRTDSGQKSVNGTTTSYGAATVAGDVVGIAYNGDDNEVTFYKNNVSQGVISITADEYVFACGKSSGNPSWVANFGQDSSFAGEKTAQGNQDDNGKGDFYYAPPSGFLALCTDNLSAPDIVLPGDYSNTVLYTGNGSTQTISSLDFQPDFVWIKNRTDGSTSHGLFNSVIGAGYSLKSNDTASLRPDGGSPGATDDMYAFTSSGFSVGTNNYINVNTSAKNYVAWNWKAGGAPTADNSAGAGATPTAGSVKIDGSNLGSALAGTIAATRLSANTTSGFSIVTYEGTEAVATVAHGLSQAPELILFKNTDSALFWPVYSKPTDATDYLILDTTAATADSDGYFNDTEPTSTVFSLGDKTNLNRDTCIAYCFHSIEGYSKVGSYVGNGSADGTFVYTGFEPSFILYKLYDGEAGQNWVIEDAARNPYNYLNKTLLPNSSAAEADSTSTVAGIDFVSNGIKFRGTDNGMNYSGYDYIYMAFAESPTKFSNAR